MKIISKLVNIIFYLKVKSKRVYDIRLMRKYFEYSKIYSYKWRYAYFCYKENKILGKSIDSRVPVSPQNHILYFNNLKFDIQDLKNLSGTGKYFQCVGQVEIGSGTFIANNVAIITANHELLDLKKHQAPKPVSIGRNCWIGINSTILPGVKLGDNTIVGAGSVVTKSFEGKCVVCGNPAKIIRYL